jgi:hypothetical protein
MWRAGLVLPTTTTRVIVGIKGRTILLQRVRVRRMRTRMRKARRVARKSLLARRPSERDLGSLMI